jgi:acyl-CoA dehydrogenase
MAMLFLGGNLKRKENLSARLGDILSYLYIASAVLKYNKDHDEPESDDAFVKWSLDYSLFYMQQQLNYFLLNFPYQVIATPLRWLIFPFWRNYRLPSDSLALKLSASMMQPSEFRERITAHCVLSDDPADAIGRVETAWLAMIKVEPLLSKLELAVKQGVIDKSYGMHLKIKLALDNEIISKDDADQLSEYENMRFDAMQVDDFSSAELTGKKS